MTARILVTGVAGYLGSHVAVALAQAGFDVIGLDTTVDRQALTRLRHLCGERLVFERVDVRDSARVLEVLSRHRPAAVMHLALLAAGRGAPLAYYDINVHGLTTLLGAMAAAGLRTLVLASSSAVYGAPVITPVSERAVPAAFEPHGRTLATCEHLLTDLRAADARWRFGVLRVFEAVGTHDSGLIGDFAPNDGSVLAQALDVAGGQRARIDLAGGDWPTRDGTRVRDWVHVLDVADGFLRALEALARGTGSFTVNLGRGQGVSELQLVAALERVARRPLPFHLAGRSGGIAEIFADVRRAQTLLGWSARLGVDRICADAWRARRLNRRALGELAAPSSKAMP